MPGGGPAVVRSSQRLDDDPVLEANPAGLAHARWRMRRGEGARVPEANGRNRRGRQRIASRPPRPRKLEPQSDDEVAEAQGDPLLGVTGPRDVDRGDQSEIRLELSDASSSAGPRMEPLWSLRLRGSGGLGWAEQTRFVPSNLRHRLGPSRTPSCSPPVARRLHTERECSRCPERLYTAGTALTRRRARVKTRSPHAPRTCSRARALRVLRLRNSRPGGRIGKFKSYAA